MARLCKICSSDLSEDHKKRRLKTVTSVRAELSEIVVDVCGDVSKTIIERFVRNESRYLCRECHSTIIKYIEVRPRIQRVKEKIAVLMQQVGT